MDSLTRQETTVMPEWLAYLLLFGGLALIFVSVATAIMRAMPWWPREAPATMNNSPEDDPPPGGIGGRGGDAKVGGSGIGLGGPGGRAGSGGRRGGDGGDAQVEGDGIAAGGEDGHAGESNVWKPPARSGYEVHQRQMGLPVDPLVAQFGRGGASAGWQPRMDLVQRIREEYLASHGGDPNDIASVPLDHINRELQAQRIEWRSRIVDDQYEFFIPKG